MRCAGPARAGGRLSRPDRDPPGVAAPSRVYTPRMSETPELTRLRDRVVDYLARLDLDLDPDGQGIFLFKHGSTVVLISLFELDGHRWVRFVATVLTHVTPSMDLLGRLLRMNTEVVLGAFLLFDDGTVAFSHTLLADQLDFEEFDCALSYVAQVGDDYDEELQSIAGGLRAEDVLLGV